MKKMFIAALASLMLAGALSTVSGATQQTKGEMIIMTGEGSAPLPVVPSSAGAVGDAASVDR